MVLAGGRGSRLGGVEKGEIRVGGERLIDIVVRGAREAGCDEVVIAGDIEAEGARSVRERPPYGGPAAGLGAALAGVRSDWVMLLACDLPHAGELCCQLAGSLNWMDADLDGSVVTADGRVQWLAGLYRRSSLETAIARAGALAGKSMKAVLGDLKLREVPDAGGWSRDLDTPEDLDELRKEQR